MSTAAIAARGVPASVLQEPLRNTYFSPASFAGFNARQSQLLSSISTGRNFQQLADWQMRCPLTVVVTSHAPEAHFVRELIHPNNRGTVTSWVKSPDQGFYAIPYVNSEGDKKGRTSNFNPDFFLLQEGGPEDRAHIYLVETKDEGDLRIKNRDKVKFAEAYVARLNAAVGPDRPSYSFHLLSPGDILGFFADLRSGEGPSFVGVLHQQLRSNVLDPAELGDADIDLDDSAWDDDEDGDS